MSRAAWDQVECWDEGYADGYADGTADTLDQSDIEPTYDEGFEEGYRTALEDAHAAIAAGDQDDPALTIIEELIDEAS